MRRCAVLAATLLVILLLGSVRSGHAQTLNDLWRGAILNCGNGQPCVNITNVATAVPFTTPQTLNDLLKGAFQNCGGTPCLTTVPSAGSPGPFSSITTTAPVNSLGPELVAGMACSNWVLNQGGTGWDAACTGGLNKNADGFGQTSPNPAITPVVGTTYRITLTYSAFSVGFMDYSFGGVVSKTALGAAACGGSGGTTCTDYITAATTGTLFLSPSTTSRFTISNVSIRVWSTNTATGSFDGLVTLNNGLKINGGSIGVGSNPVPGTGIYFQDDAGPSLVIEGAAGDSGAGVKAGANLPGFVFLTGYGPNNPGSVTSVIASNGVYTTVGFAVISGRFTATYNKVTGAYLQTNSGATGIATMLDLTPDVNDTVVIRTNNTSNALTMIDNTTSFTEPNTRNFILASAGMMTWGAPAAGNTVSGTQVSKIAITAAGTGCNTTTPSLTFSGGGCTQEPTATATASGGVLQTVTLATSGFGCTSVPSIAVGNSCTGTVTATLMDVGLGRNSAGVLEVNNSIPGTFADLRTRGVGIGAAPNGQNVIAFAGFLFTNIAANLTANGQIGYCSDCTIANPCAGGGTGAIAKRLNNVNVCN